MPVRIVQSAQNARLRELRRALFRPGRVGGQLVALEGPNLLEEALRAGLEVKEVFVADDAQFLLDGKELAPRTDVLLTPRKMLVTWMSVETPQPIAALFYAPDWTWTDVLGAKTPPVLIVILAGVQDPGNVGTILRSAEAFGVNGVISLPGTVSPWNQKAIRASAGSVFRLPVIQSSVEECFSRLREGGVKVLKTAARGATVAEALDFTAPTALLIGNEGNGVPDEIAARADGAVTIPCPGPVESLNASVAAGVLLYEASRQRRVATAATRSRP